MVSAINKKEYTWKIVIIIALFLISILSVFICVGIGTLEFSFHESIRACFINSDTEARLIIYNLRLPRILSAGLVGVCLSLSGCILQGVMRNNLASPSIIGVTSGASFIGYLTLVVFPSLSYILTPAAILGAFFTTMMIYLLAYQKGISPVKMVLAGLAISAVFGAFNDIIRIFYAEDIGNASGFLVGGFNSVVWKDFKVILPFSLIAIFVCAFLPSKLNILMLGDEVAHSLGLRVEPFRLLLIVVSSFLAGSAVSIAGLIGFVGLIVPHIARLIIGSDYKFLFPTSMFIGFILLVVCDTIGRVILETGEVPVSVILAFIGAPFFLYLLRKREVIR
jgi:iron complex transport system permease protein